MSAVAKQSELNAKTNAPAPDASSAILELTKDAELVPPAKRRGELSVSPHLDSHGHPVDWRVNTRHYDFIGAVFDPLTPMQTLQRAKWMTTGHSFRYVVTPNVDHLVRLAREPEVYRPLYDASWLSVCDSRILEAMAQISGLPLSAVPGSDLTQQLFDNVITAEDTITVIGADTEILNRI